MGLIPRLGRSHGGGHGNPPQYSCLKNPMNRGCELQSMRSESQTGLKRLAGAKSLQSCPTLCDQADGSPPGSSVHGILQARILEWVAISSSMHLQCMKVKSESEVTQSCPTLSDPMDCSLPSSLVHGIFQARVLEWGAIAFSKRLSTYKAKVIGSFLL